MLLKVSVESPVAEIIWTSCADVSDSPAGTTNACTSPLSRSLYMPGRPEPSEETQTAILDPSYITLGNPPVATVAVSERNEVRLTDFCTDRRR